MAKQKDSRELAKDHMFQKRLKDRLTTYLQTEIKSNDHIVSSPEVTEHLKQKYNEYNRRDVKAFEKQIQQVITSMFAEVNTTNIRKSFYKKKDLLHGLKDDNDGVV